jgi:hypothetical protein
MDFLIKKVFPSNTAIKGSPFSLMDFDKIDTASPIGKGCLII